MNEDYKIDDTTKYLNVKDAVRKTLLHQNNDNYSTELDPAVFHPSAAGKCKRQIFLSKLGQNWFSSDVQGKFAAGTAIHEWLEERMGEYLGTQDLENEYVFEEGIGFRHDGIKFKGRADFFDGEVVTDFKTRAGWYHFDLPIQRHIDQVLIYMKALDADAGRILYLRKKDLQLRQYPEEEGAAFEFDEQRFNEIVEKLKEVKEAVKERVENREEGDYVRDLDDVPFDNCGECYPCRKESEQTYEFQRDLDGEEWHSENHTDNKDREEK